MASTKLIGTAPDQVPTNADLGTMAYRDQDQFVGKADADYLAIFTEMAQKLPLSGGTLTGGLTVGGNLLLSPNAGSSRYVGFSSGSDTTLVLQAGASSGSGANLELTRDHYAYLDANTTKFRSTDAATTFMELSSSGVLLNAGTANGVAYLNGSKVLTSGSALTFNGTNLGIGTSSPSGAAGTTLAINGGASQARLALKNTSTGDAAGDGLQIVLDNTAGGIEMRENLPLYFTTNNTERARIDSSGNLGLGVTPSAWGSGWDAFEYLGGALATYSGLRSYLLNNAYSDGTNYIYKNNGYAESYLQWDGKHAWFTAPSGTAGNAISFTQAMTLDASGRLLLGTTSARTNLFGSASANFQVEGLTGDASRIFAIRNSTTTSTNGGSIVLAASKGTTVGSNTALSSGDRIGVTQFLGADGTGLIEAANIAAFVDGTPGTNDMPGRLVFSTTADGASSPTERMRIDSSGNVGIGTSSPSGRLHVAVTTAGDTSLSLQRIGSSRFEFQQGIVGVTGDALFLKDTTLSRDYLALRDGNVGIGTSSPASLLHLSANGTPSLRIASADSSGSPYIAFFQGGTEKAYIQQVTATDILDIQSDGPITLKSGGTTERLRIDSSGNVGIGTSSPVSILTVNGERAQFNHTFVGASTPLQIRNGSATTNGRGAGIEFVGPSNTFGRIDGHWAGTDERLRLFATGSMTFASGGTTERMRIDSSGNVGIGTSSPGSLLHVYKSTGYSQVEIQSGSVDAFFNSYDTGLAATLGTASNHALKFATNNTERMRIDSSGNVGIGTSSPGAKLDVAGNLSLGGGGTSAVFARIWTANGYSFFGTESSTGGAIVAGTLGYYNVIRAPGGAGTQFVTGSTITATLDSSGNLGLGVTPSAWTSAWRALQIGGSASGSLYSPGGGLRIGSNLFRDDSDYKYVGTGAAAELRMDAGAFIFRTAPSGTAGAGISFTQAMTLDASGNLFVGQSSLPAGWTGITRSVSLKQGNASIIGFVANAYNSDRGIYMGHDGTIGAIGVSYGSSGGYSPLTFWTSDTERARIDSSGNLLVGTTSTGYSASNSIEIGTLGRVVVNHANGTSSGTFYMAFGYNSGGIGSITQNGTTAVAYNTSSDYRLKENIQPMTGALAKVAALKPVIYKWKADGSYGEGFIAHELAEVVPQCVTGEKDAVDDEGKPVYQGIDTSFLVATLTAAIQEQQAQIEQLRAEIQTLKGN